MADRTQLGFGVHVVLEVCMLADSPRAVREEEEEGSVARYDEVQEVVTREGRRNEAAVAAGVQVRDATSTGLAVRH